MSLSGDTAYQTLSPSLTRSIQDVRFKSHRRLISHREQHKFRIRERLPQHLNSGTINAFAGDSVEVRILGDAPHFVQSFLDTQFVRREDRGGIRAMGSGDISAQHKAREVQRTVGDHLIAVGYVLGAMVVAVLWTYVVFWL